MIQSEKKPVKTDVRHPVLEMSDKIEEVREAIRREPSMRDDERFQYLFREIQKAKDEYSVHLNENYLWD